MRTLWAAIILILSQYQVLAQDHCCEEYCFGKDNEREQTRHFSAKTAYQIAKGAGIDKYVEIPNCSPTKMWILTRHGTRLPSAKYIEQASKLDSLRDQVVNNYKVLKSKPTKGALCLEDLFSIQAWKFNSSITPDMEYLLTSQGWEDIKLLAKTYQRLYPNILTKEYQSPNFLFRHSDTQRTEESFKAFVDGLFGQNAYKDVYLSHAQGNDTLLRPYDYCPAWEESKEQNNDVDAAYNKFKNSALMNKTVSDISTRLGYRYSLEFSDILLMWDMCRYEQAWNIDRISAWCGVFTPSQLYVLEYYDDLRYYYESGYGREINSHLSCEVVKDLLFQLNSKTVPNAVVYFAHSTLIQTVITALGINKDSVTLTDSNYDSMGNRRWQTSKMDPFASNLVAIKYNCPNDPNDSEKVMFLLNQNPVDLDWCNVGLCDWTSVLKQYVEFFKADCGEIFCQSGATSLGRSSIHILIMAAFVYLINFLH